MLVEREEERKSDIDSRIPNNIIENDSDHSMQGQKTKRIDHITIDNEIDDSDEEDTNHKRLPKLSKILQNNKKNKFLMSQIEDFQGISS